MFIQILIAIPAFLVVITVLVAVHEFGHYWVAKKFGIKVERFSIGFGKPIWKKRFSGNETEFVISALPLGGYVKMLDERTTEDIPPEDIKRAFNRQAPWKRILVLLGGPMINLFFAILVFWLLFMIGVQTINPLVAPIDNTSAQMAGLEAGDLIVSVEDKKVTSYEEFVVSLFDVILDGKQSGSDEFSSGKNNLIGLQVERNGKMQRIS